jgi:5-methylcytosine-specific restriction endonuclease McrA
MGRPVGKRTASEQADHEASRLAHFGNALCRVCGKQFPRYKEGQEVCSPTKCKLRWSAIQRKAKAGPDPYWGKAWSLTGSVRLSGKVEIVRGMILRAIDNPCEYCGGPITLETASLDHRAPRTLSRVRGSGTLPRYTPDELRALDSEENLHIVCRSCNQLKSDMNDEQFHVFSNFLDQRPDIRALISARLRMATLVWQHRRRS